MKRIPTAVSRALREIGEHVSVQRRLLELTMADVAQRAGVSVGTVSNIEHGRPAGTDSLFSVLNVLQLARPAVEATDPYHTDLGVLRAAERLPKRVRNRQ